MVTSLVPLGIALRIYNLRSNRGAIKDIVLNSTFLYFDFIVTDTVLHSGRKYVILMGWRIQGSLL